MPAIRGINLRSGDLAEQLGLLLMQNLALVVPVPRTEDVGVDAVVTLLQEHDSRRLIASDSFFVQLKARSVESIEFVGHEVQWLYGLELPFFIGSIDKTTSSIRLYCCHRLSDALVTNFERQKIVIHLAAEVQPADFVDASAVDVCVGPPILEWTLAQANDKRIQVLFYETCRAHVHAYRDALVTRRVGYVPFLSWGTNSPLKNVGWKTICSRPPGEQIDDIADLLMPYFSMLLDESARAGDSRWLMELKSRIDMGLAIIEAISPRKDSEARDDIESQHRRQDHEQL
jgi:hypothetical protein